MKATRLCKITAGVLVAALVVTSRAAQSEAQRQANDISHFVRFEAGQKQFSEGDRITIDEIHGTTDTISVGHLYEIKGTYALASHPDAQLTVDVTSNDPRHFPRMNTQTITVQKGDGHFTVYLYMWTQGDPHVSFYPTDGGSSFASVYFAATKVAR